VKRVLIIGGYGNFGSYIARRLAADSTIQLLIGGRSIERARQFADSLEAANRPESVAIDISSDLEASLAAAASDIVIHTVGPFQGQDYSVAEACIAIGAHYLDLADARAFVAGIGVLDGAARSKGVAVISGASSVPCLSAAIVDHYLPSFERLESIDYGISAAQQTNRGLATASAVLSYIGQPFTSLRSGRRTAVTGWQELRSVRYPELGRRWFGNCDIPDLDLFPRRYPSLRTMRFAAGHEIASLHIGTWLLGALVKARLLPRLDRFAPQLLKASFLFDPLGSGRSGMHMFLDGIDPDGRRKRIRFFLIARQGHGPEIPCMPAILLVRRLARGDMIESGARPCLDLIDLPEYLRALNGLDISVIVEGADAPA
jgi:Saccharopine dehydrogenase NADP binding domain